MKKGQLTNTWGCEVVWQRLESRTRVGSTPIIGTISHKSTANSAVYPFKVG